ncbi:hypothetical protein BU26DRAFT_584082 [Trematosphaeria pertusa]|uniref:Uncharacterized protein n=1 Tax=Trematosphaeria pertusa TaxID=390896 RepID=A0A6A6IXZ6_9PLEO|nr:uncharacterized protein BU26DRAFT_584082 [Trematosphaeria pertusa]KAF2255359.1 hypothetical protein BU26DRAFT_584082 [Trematosphaeria pertusa]
MLTNSKAELLRTHKRTQKTPKLREGNMVKAGCWRARTTWSSVLDTRRIGFEGRGMPWAGVSSSSKAANRHGSAHRCAAFNTSKSPYPSNPYPSNPYPKIARGRLMGVLPNSWNRQLFPLKRFMVRMRHRYSQIRNISPVVHGHGFETFDIAVYVDWRVAFACPLDLQVAEPLDDLGGSGCKAHGDSCAGSLGHNVGGHASLHLSEIHRYISILRTPWQMLPQF